MNPVFSSLRKVVYIVFDNIVKSLGGYKRYKRVLGLANLMGAFRNNIGYVGGTSKNDYLNAITASFPDKSPLQRRNILLNYWKDHQKMFLELFMYDEMNPGNIGEFVSFEGIENIEAALDEGKGAILPVPHIGNIRLLHYSLALKGYPVSVVSSGYTDDPEIVRKFKLSETSKVQQIGFRGQNPRWIMEALKSNRLVQIASTAEAGNAGVEVKFMNRKLFLTNGWVRLAIMTASPILPAYILRGEDNRHTVHIESSFPLAEGKNKAEIIDKTAQAFMSRIEKVYRKYPHLIDWMSWHNRLDEANRHFKA